MELSFDRFKLRPELDESVGCLHNSLQVYDGDYKSGDSLGIYCDSAVPELLKSSGRFMRVGFISETGYDAKWPGFKATFKAVDKQSKSSFRVGMKPHHSEITLSSLEEDLNRIEFWSQHSPKLCTLLSSKTLSFQILALIFV